MGLTLPIDYTITKRKDFTEVLELINSNKDKNIIAGCQSITGGMPRISSMCSV